MYLFGRYLDHHSHKGTLRTMFYLSSLSFFTRALSFIPLGLNDTLAKLLRNLKIQAQDVVNYDTLNDHVRPHQRDEAIIAEESLFDLSIAATYLLSATSATLIGFHPTFLLLSLITIILTAALPQSRPS
jgi:hypothetical protein